MTPLMPPPRPAILERIRLRVELSANRAIYDSMLLDPELQRLLRRCWASIYRYAVNPHALDGGSDPR